MDILSRTSETTTVHYDGNILPYFRFEKMYFYPWMKDSILTENLFELYDADIKNFAEWVSPTIEERIMRYDVINRVSEAIKTVLPDAKIEIYGSFESDLCVPQSDIDIVIFNPTSIKDNQKLAVLSNIAFVLHKKKISKSMPTVISMTKVPIIKLVDRKTNCMVDINLECDSGTKNTNLMKKYLEKYECLRPLALILKYYLKLCFLNDTWIGGIGSYSLLIMIISYLQNREQIESDPKEYLSAMLIGFLEYYGKKFDYTNNVVSILCKMPLTKEEKNWKNDKFPNSLSVEDPNNPSNDLGKVSFNIEKVKLAFQKGYESLINCVNDRSTESFVARLIHIPQSEINYRNTIKILYRKKLTELCDKDISTEFKYCNLKGKFNEDIKVLKKIWRGKTTRLLFDKKSIRHTNKYSPKNNDVSVNGFLEKTEDKKFNQSDDYNKLKINNSRKE